MPTSPNTYNSALTARRSQLARAWRFPMAPGCPLVAPKDTAASRRNKILSVPIDAAAAGDNVLLSTLSGKKLIYEIFIWNVAAQTLKLYAGNSTTGILLTRITDFPATSGLTLGFNGNEDMVHWEIDSGQVLTLNLQNATQVDGFIRYKIV